MEHFELTKDVIVFKNVLKDPSAIFRTITESKTNKQDIFTDWVDWGSEGYKTTMDPYDTREHTGHAAEMLEEFKSIFWECLKIYKDNYINEDFIKSVDPDMSFAYHVDNKINKEWASADILIVDYANSPDDDNGFINGYHTDVTPWFPPSTHAFTINIYPNDDFDGGGISYIDLENATKDTFVDPADGETKDFYWVDKPIDYFPEAGDAMLFKSGHYHGVYGVKNGQKVFVRMFFDSPLPQASREILSNMTEAEIKTKIQETRSKAFKEYSHQMVVVNKKEDLVSTFRSIACVIKPSQLD